eukprot:CAMPEP_0177744492 /NCGR_PEP_ID=MMETSP0484_2-20121128/29781_1 /TAXON_ID=354590 /ORGANISM="Rhodomonas lens, Strain RHODO" /LENGTH=443 /DNA_ID=CAMNT_0019259011 /DNA_START=186 /DNA_END=1515 /DNA_ORIENTATION=-
MREAVLDISCGGPTIVHSFANPYQASFFDSSGKVPSTDWVQLEESWRRRYMPADARAENVVFTVQLLSPKRHIERIEAVFTGEVDRRQNIVFAHSALLHLLQQKRVRQDARNEGREYANGCTGSGRVLVNDSGATFLFSFHAGHLLTHESFRLREGSGLLDDSLKERNCALLPGAEHPHALYNACDFEADVPGDLAELGDRRVVAIDAKLERTAKFLSSYIQTRDIRRDIELVMAQTCVSRSRAIQALAEEKLDVVDAILLILEQQQADEDAALTSQPRPLRAIAATACWGRALDGGSSRACTLPATAPRPPPSNPAFRSPAAAPLGLKERGGGTRALCGGTPLPQLASELNAWHAARAAPAQGRMLATPASVRGEAEARGGEAEARGVGRALRPASTVLLRGADNDKTLFRATRGAEDKESEQARRAVEEERARKREESEEE